VISEEEKLKKPTEYIIRKIGFKFRSTSIKNSSFLFILDNCDSIEKTKEYFDLIIQDSTLTSVKFLITTTEGSPFTELKSIMDYISVCSKHIIIEPFNKEESIDFIKSNLNDVISEENELNELIDSLVIQDERPVTLIKIIALVKLKHESINDLIEEFKLNKRSIEVIEYNLFENLIIKEEKAWEVLKQSSFLDPDFSPLSIYTDLFEINEDEFFGAIDVLAKLSLITTEEDDEGMEYGIRIHRTLQHEANQFLELKYENEYEEILKYQRDKVYDILENKESNKWKKLKYYNNFKETVQNNLKNKKLNQKIKSELCWKFADYSRETNLNFENSLVYYSKSIEINRKIFGTDDHSDIANSFNNIGSVYYSQGRHEKSLENTKKSLEIYRKIFGTDEHSYIASTLNNIANIYKDLGRHEEALENYSKSFEINRKIFGTDEHSSIAQTLNNIGLIYFNQGRYENKDIWNR